MIRVVALTTATLLGVAACGGSPSGASVVAIDANATTFDEAVVTTELPRTTSSTTPASTTFPAMSAPNPTAPTEPVVTPPEAFSTMTTPSTTTTNNTSTTTATTTTTPATTTTTTIPPAPPVRSGAIVSPNRQAGDPMSISIPSIGVSSVITPTGYLDDGTVDVPADATIAGWFEPGPRPGERGPAVIMGHVDSYSQGPGVFYRLREIEVGAEVTVESSTGPVRFVVRSVEQFAKDEFPTERVYGPVPDVALRLITCGGSFDRSVRSYRDNIVAFLVPVGS